MELPQRNQIGNNNQQQNKYLEISMALFLSLLSIGSLSIYYYKIDNDPNYSQILLIVCWFVAAMLIGFLTYTGFSEDGESLPSFLFISVLFIASGCIVLCTPDKNINY